MIAETIKGSVQVQSEETLPDGTRCILVAIDGYQGYAKGPAAIRFNGREYGRTGWNSDRNIAYYKSDRKFGQAC